MEPLMLEGFIPKSKSLIPIRCPTCSCAHTAEITRGVHHLPDNKVDLTAPKSRISRKQKTISQGGSPTGVEAGSGGPSPLCANPHDAVLLPGLRRGHTSA